MRRFFLFGVFLLSLRGQDATQILRRSIELDAADNERLKNYTYNQTNEIKVHHGKKPDTTEFETYEVTMLGGEPYQRLIAKDGKPLAAKEERKEQEKLDREFVKRQHESPSDKAKKEKEQSEERKFLTQLPDAYTLHLEGVEQVSGKPAWVIRSEPKPGFRPKGSDAKILTKVRGKVWIDQAEYQWVKAEVETIDTVSITLALLRLAPGTHLTFEQTRVNEEVWLPSHFHLQADARLGYLFKVSGDLEVTYSDYKKFQTDSRILSDEAGK